MATKVYDPDKVAAIFGAVPINGWAEDEFIRITPTSEAFVSVVGVDGEVTRSKTKDGRMRVSFILAQSSFSNALLSAIHLSDLEGSNGAGIGICSITDLSGSTLFLAPEGWIVGWPEQGYGKQSGNREWVIECANPIVFIGGN